ncbi:hypothetical protein LB506_000969 [Fusarium annulatum]|nr:hypothetical protein LB506_000969 [Fusarium annulatum]
MSLVFSRLDIMLQPKAIGYLLTFLVPLTLVSRRLKLVQPKFCPAETFSQVPVRLTSRTWELNLVPEANNLKGGLYYIQGKDKTSGM